MGPSGRGVLRGQLYFTGLMPPPTKDSTAELVSISTMGMNSGVAPRMLPQQQLAFAINITNRGGLPRTRPTYRKVPLSYVDNSTQAHATQSLFQCASYYRAIGSGENCLVASIGGRLFRYLVGSSNVVQDISVATDLNSSVNPNCWMFQAEDFLITNNGAADPLFFDGASTRRSAGIKGGELPAGCMGAYVQGRCWFALPSQAGSSEVSSQFMAGDLVYSHGYSGIYNGRDSILQTQENNFFSGGGAFSVPISAGAITAMSSVAIADTSLGQGPLQVLTQSSVFSVQVPLDRAEWALTTYPLMTIGLPNYGATGQLAVATVNGDLWYRSVDGVRSYQIARRDFNTWVNTPLSVEMDLVFNQDTERFLNKASSLVFDNRLLMTCAPFEVRDRGMAHLGLVALDFNNISTLTSRSQPAYDGLWTGLNILQLVKGPFNGVERCFAFCLDCVGRIVLYEILNDGAAYFDWDGVESVPIESSFETRAMGWGDGGNALKRLQCADLYVDRVAGPGDGTVNAAFYYRSDQDPSYNAWHNFSMCAPIAVCPPSVCPVFAPLTPQYRTYIRLPDPADNCTEVTGRMIRTGYEFQIRMKWTGYLQLNRIHAWSQRTADSTRQVCPTTQACVMTRGCDYPWFTYSTEGCGTTAGDCFGIVEEDTSICITTEGGVVIRTEDQEQHGTPPDLPVLTEGACVIQGASGTGTTACTSTDPTSCSDAGGSYQGNASMCGTPPFTPPVWPPPDDFTCVGRNVFGPLYVDDPITGDHTTPGIQPGAQDPNVYLASFPGCLLAWCAAVWSEFIASGTPYTQARLIWYNSSTGGYDFPAYQVFPNQAGNYNHVIQLDVKIFVEYCSP